MRRKEERSNLWISYTHPDSTNRAFFLFFFVLVLSFLESICDFKKKATTHNKTPYKTSQLTPSTETPTFLLLCLSRAEINSAAENLGKICVGLGVWRAELQKNLGRNLLRRVHPTDQKPHPGSGQATPGLFTTARDYAERTESRGDRSGWREWKHSC